MKTWNIVKDNIAIGQICADHIIENDLNFSKSFLIDGKEILNIDTVDIGFLEVLDNKANAK